ncbi:hypothetical protein DNHGIG_13280 [Collibacillus ludicampi]|uniref:Small, acid-soluble spore protein, alpha/beta type n=1 Tax=Collibacillus ludicampi TaxID=2771369 RepID=A0AAV4LD59_9BACL|nr:alpha/beta-type small acid-soluble spore protein [Collibacillus ludicampi]GIM45779.1 hypothetical protein DNHGIG_13280 [Collibacillus ludicampi]
MNIEDPQVKQMIEQMKWEIARELGIPLSNDGYWGNLSTKDCGKIGQLIKKRIPVILRYQQRKK